MLLFFPVSEEYVDLAIQSFLDGLRSTFQAIPLLGGTVKTIPDGTGQIGTLAITSPWQTVDEIFVIKKFKKYNYLDLRRKQFPPSSLSQRDFVISRFSLDSNLPVMQVQFTIIEGGIVLNPCVHHSFADGAGATSIFQIWAAYCRGEVLNDLSSLWQPVTLLQGDEKRNIEDFPDYTYREKTHLVNKRTYMDHQGPMSTTLNEKLMKLVVFSYIKYRSLHHCTRVIYFSHANLARLKDTVSDELGNVGDKWSQETVKVVDDNRGQEVGDKQIWISTLDTLSALLFCCITQSRHVAKRKQSPTALFITNVNVRKHCQLPQNYIRSLVLPCNLQSPLHELTPSIRNIATQAHNLRARLRLLDTPHVQRVASMIRSVPDVSKITSSAIDSQMNPLIMTSWRDQVTCDIDWGSQIGVKCERVRVCHYGLDGLIVVMPKYSADGGLEVVLQLRKDVMKELERDEVFNQFATWR